MKFKTKGKNKPTKTVIVHKNNEANLIAKGASFIVLNFSFKFPKNIFFCIIKKYVIVKILASKAKTANSLFPENHNAITIKNLLQKPANGGIPAVDKKAIIDINYPTIIDKWGESGYDWNKPQVGC